MSGGQRGTPTCRDSPRYSIAAEKAQMHDALAYAYMSKERRTACTMEVRKWQRKLASVGGCDCVTRPAHHLLRAQRSAGSHARVARTPALTRCFAPVHAKLSTRSSETMRGSSICFRAEGGSGRTSGERVICHRLITTAEIMYYS